LITEMAEIPRYQTHFYCLCREFVLITVLRSDPMARQIGYTK